MPIITQRENNGMGMFLMFQQYAYLWLFLRNGRLHITRNFLINYLKYNGSSVQEEANQAPRPLTLSKKNILFWRKQAFCSWKEYLTLVEVYSTDLSSR